MSTSRKSKMPEIGRRVKVFNTVTETWMTGEVTQHLSTQWILGMDRLHAMVIHSSWEWKYAESGE